MKGYILQGYTERTVDKCELDGSFAAAGDMGAISEKRTSMTACLWNQWPGVEGTVEIRWRNLQPAANAT